MKKEQQSMITYEPPQVEFVEVEIELGFATSGVGITGINVSGWNESGLGNYEAVEN